VLTALIGRFAPKDQELQILEAGCGYGGNLQMLKEFGSVDSFEMDNQARQYASTLLGREVAYGYLPEKPGFEGRKFDLIAMLDVLEHIDDDVNSLAALRERMAEGGRILITVPALPWLWSKHDEVHHHKRRYTRKSLNRALEKAGLAPVKTGYFNTLLFPLAVIQRMAQRLLGTENSVDELPPSWMNALFTAAFGLERTLVGKLPMPIGLSLFAVAELPRD
jgi:SAM-dependent methyltransferase